MKKQLKSLLLITLLAGCILPAWGQATPSTEGQDFWVTFLRAADDDPTELKLTISAREACDVHIENPQNPRTAIDVSVGDNSSTEIGTQSQPYRLVQTDCYSSNNGTATYTALHVTATKDISLFAGNYRDKSFDATNVLPTSALLDDYLIQTYPPSDHENKPQGSHFAIIAVEDGETTIDYNLTAKAGNENIGAHNVTLKKGQVWYVWTGKNDGDAADLSGTTVKARNNKKIAVFQGCPHTNIPYSVRDRDHIISQAMPTAYWGSEFGITASRKHRRDIVAVMALNDGTEVYINAKDGEPRLVHTFDFSQDKKHYWTFEIGEEVAYCADNEGQSPSHGKLPAPLVIDSSCYLTTSCPAGVHLFMVSNRYDNVVPKVDDDTLVSDPAMLWISPIEQVIKEINFATYKTQQAKFHFMNILTDSANVKTMTWNGQSIAKYFHPLMGNPDYSFARIEINEGNHNLKGYTGFLAHVYGYGERESYAYSCGSSTVQRSITFNGMPLMIDSIYSGHFCVDKDIEMKLNIGNNNYESVKWDFGDGTTYISDANATNQEKRTATHAYSIPGWYDLEVSAVYTNTCTGKKHNENMRFSFRVQDAKKIYHKPSKDCMPEDYEGPSEDIKEEEFGDCDSIVITPVFYAKESSYEYDYTAQDVAIINGVEYTNSQDVSWDTKNSEGCPHHITCHLTIVKCLDLDITNEPQIQHVCMGETYDLPYSYDADGYPGRAVLVRSGYAGEAELSMAGTTEVDHRRVGDLTLPIEKWEPGTYKAQVKIEDLNCNVIAESPELEIVVYYPKDVFVQKFDNVLALYAPGNGGNKGYTFTGYQWYRNGESIPGATNAVYRSETPFEPGDIYHVVLTNNLNETLPSCELEISGKANMPKKAPAAEKKLVNQQIQIVIDNQSYDIYGQRVK